jgi:hypothetical protein
VQHERPAARAGEQRGRDIVREVIDARRFLASLVGKPLKTVTGRENRVLGVSGDGVMVWTTRSPAGQEVPLAWVKDAIDRIERDREIEISVASVGYRSAFIGAVLQELPGAQVIRTSPPRIRLPPNNE